MNFNISKDIAVASILQDFVAKQKTLFGVPLSRELLAWPERLRPPPVASSTTNGGDYVAFRRALHSRYSVVWLLSLHDQDPVLYAEILYDACVDFASEEGMEESMDTFILSPDKSVGSFSKYCTFSWNSIQDWIGITQASENPPLYHQTTTGLSCVQRI